MASSINIPAASLPAVLSGSDIEKLVMDGLLVQCHVTLSLNTVLLSCKNKSNSNNKMETLSSHIGDEILINVFNSHAKAFKKLQNNIVTLIMSRYPTTEHVSIRRFMTNSNIKDHNIKFFAITYKEVVINKKKIEDYLKHLTLSEPGGGAESAPPPGIDHLLCFEKCRYELQTS